MQLICLLCTVLVTSGYAKPSDDSAGKAQWVPPNIIQVPNQSSEDVDHPPIQLALDPHAFPGDDSLSLDQQLFAMLSRSMNDNNAAAGCVVVCTM